MPDDSDIERDGAVAGESKNVYEAIFREMSDAVFLIDVEQSNEDYTFTYRRNNASHQEQSGLSEDELRGQTPQELLGDEQGSVVNGNYRRCVEQGETIEYEETLDLPGGESHWQTKLTPVTDSGRVTKIVGVARDITEQQEQEQKLQQIHRRFETVVKTMSAAVFLKNTDGEYLMMNQACRELFNKEERTWFHTELARESIRYGNLSSGRKHVREAIRLNPRDFTLPAMLLLTYTTPKIASTVVDAYRKIINAKIAIENRSE